MPLKIDKYNFRIPFFTIDKFLVMPDSKKALLFKKVRESIILQAGKKKFIEPNGAFSVVVEFNFPEGPKDVLHAYAVTGILVLLILFPRYRDTVRIKSNKKNYDFKKFLKMMNVSFRFGRRKPKEEEINLFIHHNVL